MAKQILATGAVLLGVCALTAGTPALADRHGDGAYSRAAAAPMRHAPRHHRQHYARALHPAVPYRGPRVVGPNRGPDFLIHAYLPRLTDKPIYNEPPSRFPTY